MDVKTKAIRSTGVLPHHDMLVTSTKKNPRMQEAILTPFLLITRTFARSSMFAFTAGAYVTKTTLAIT
jgi:hypothetical protein